MVPEAFCDDLSLPSPPLFLPMNMEEESEISRILMNLLQTEGKDHGSGER